MGQGSEMDRVSEIIWRECLRAKKGENALIITDKQKREIGQSLLKVGKNFCECELILTSKSKIHGDEPEPEVARMMLDRDIVIVPTTHSLTHTRATKRARKTARVVTLPGITKDMFLRTIPIDYHKMNQLCEKLKTRIRGKEMRIETKIGTDLYLVQRGRKISSDTGLSLKKGELNNLPAGEVGYSPLEGKTEGKIIIDVSGSPDTQTKFGKIGLVKKPFRIDIDKGQAVDCTNPVLWKWVTSVENGTNVGEFSIGTNPKARITGRILEGEKALKTAHIAFGTSGSSDGKVRSSIHLDQVFRNPTIEVDGKVIIKDGKFLF